MEKNYCITSRGTTLDDDDDDEHDDDDHGTIHVPLYVCTTYLFIILYFIMGF